MTSVQHCWHDVDLGWFASPTSRNYRESNMAVIDLIQRLRQICNGA